MSKEVATHRGRQIKRSVDVLGFNVPAQFALCFVSGYRKEDSAPCLLFGATVEECRAEIDAIIEADAPEAAAAEAGETSGPREPQTRRAYPEAQARWDDCIGIPKR